MTRNWPTRALQLRGIVISSTTDAEKLGPGRVASGGFVWLVEEKNANFNVPDINW